MSLRQAIGMFAAGAAFGMGILTILITTGVIPS